MSAPTLRIAVLGQVEVFRIDRDGHATAIDIGGWSFPMLLAALVFRPDLHDRAVLAEELLAGDHPLWSVLPRDRQRSQVENRVVKPISLLRITLGDCGDLISKGTPSLRLMRDENPERLRIDYDIFNLCQSRGDHAGALALVRNTPLPGAEYDRAAYMPFLESIRAHLRAKVATSLAALAMEVPDDPLTFRQHLPAGTDFPDPPEWPPVTMRPVPVNAPPGEAETTGRQLRPRRARIASSQFHHDDLFEACEEGEERLALERAEAEASDVQLAWPIASGKWFGRYFAFWHKTLHTPCDEITLDYIPERYYADRFGVASSEDGDHDKATIVGTSRLLGDTRYKSLICGVTNWGFAFEWAKDHADELLELPAQPSVFGLPTRPAYPGIAGVHTLAQTSDGYLLFGLRDPQVQFHPLTWSASFEESVSIDAREFTGPLSGDATLLDPIIGGLREEWGIEDAVEKSSFLAVGREYVRTTHGRLDLSSSVLAAVRLSIDLETVWACLSNTSGVRDIGEHAAWAACRFTTREDVLRLVAAGRDRTQGIDLLPEFAAQSPASADVQVYPEGRTGVHDLGLMPTSAARLVLGSEWLWREGWLD